MSGGMTPSLFISHGAGPAFFMQVGPSHRFSGACQDSDACKAMKDIGANRQRYGLPEKPKTIVVISAHWEVNDDVFHVYSVPKPKLMYDYYGFPPHTYELEYPAPGDVELARRIVDLINNESGTGGAILDLKRGGFDHGVFLPLMLLYPDADIPIVQVSIKSTMNPTEHYALGKALAPLRQEGILIVGSGQATHPMSGKGLLSDTNKFLDEMDYAVVNSSFAEQERFEKLTGLWKNPLIKVCHHPGTEHLMPLVVAAAAARGAPGRSLFSEDYRFMRGLFSLKSYLFGTSESVSKY